MPKLDPDRYPVTLVKDRHRGAYSGARWTAWNREPDAIPSEAWDGDSECMMFWPEAKGCIVGKGTTPEEAFIDLVSKLEAVDV